MSYLSIVKIKLRNPSLIIKIVLITILFIYSINIEIPILNGYSTYLVGNNQINSLLFSIHIFSHFGIYSNYLLVGLILIIPDILEEPYLTYHLYQHNHNRKNLFKNTVLLILSYVLIYMLWFILITFIIFTLRNGFTSFTWPRNLMHLISLDESSFVVHIPADAVKLPLTLVFFIVLIKVTFGFFVLCLACFFIAFKKNNMSYGIVLGVSAYFISDFIYYNGAMITWKYDERYITLPSILNKFTLVTFFTYSDVKQNFLGDLRQTLIYEFLLIGILLYFINKLIKNKDLV